MNIYDTINKLQSDLLTTNEYKDVKKILDEIDNDAAAKEIFEEFRNKQNELNSVMQSGKEPTEEQIKNWQELIEKMQKIELLNNLLQKEQILNNLLQEINNIITKPISQLYEK